MWNLGRYSVPINAVGFLYSFFLLIWIGWPAAPYPTATTFNWSSVIFFLVLIVSLVFYLTVGKRYYNGPVTLVRKL